MSSLHFNSTHAQADHDSCTSRERSCGAIFAPSPQIRGFVVVVEGATYTSTCQAGPCQYMRIVLALRSSILHGSAVLEPIRTKMHAVKPCQHDVSMLRI